MMSNKLKFKIAWLLIFILSSHLFSPLFAQTITIPVGTTLQLSLVETISSENASVGQIVKFIVLSDVIINNNVVIGGGSIATGQVATVEENGMFGKPGSLGIILKSAIAVDRTTVPISATKVTKGDDKTTEALVITLLLCIFGLFVRGGDAELQAGNIIEATTIGSVDVIVGQTGSENLGINEKPIEKVNLQTQLSEKVKLYMDIEKVSEQFILVRSLENANVKVEDKLNIVRYQFNKGGYVTIGIGEVVRIENGKFILKFDLFDDNDKILISDQVQYK